MPRTFETIIHWGDCDEQGVVFYPRYFYWMDCAYHGLLRRNGLSLRKLRSQFGVIGNPLVKATATFLAPASSEQRLSIESEVSRWGTTSFEITHQGSSDNGRLFEGVETRVWLLPGDGAPRPGVIPAEFRAALSGSAK
jgi:4-hydroxybenzoyl-CoA thioesterase